MGNFSLLFLTSPFLLSQTIFLVLRLHNNIHWIWGIIFIPIWILFLLWSIFLTYAIWRIIHNSKEQEYNNNQGRKAKFHEYLSGWDLTRKEFIFQVSIILTSVFFFLLLTVRLQQNDTQSIHKIPLIIVTLPVIFLSIIVIVVQAFLCWFGSKYETTSVNHNSVYRWTCLEINTLLFTLAWMGVLVLTILIVFQLEKDVNNRIKWGIIFIPLWIIFFLWLLVIIIIMLRKYYKSLPKSEQRATFTMILLSIIAWITLLVFSAFLTTELDSPGKIGIITLFFPLLFLFGSMFIVPSYFYYRYKRKEETKYVQLYQYEDNFL